MAGAMRYNLAGLTKAVVVLVALTILADVAAVVDAASTLSFFDAVESGLLTEEEFDQRAASVDALTQAVGVYALAINLICIVTSCFWIYRASANARDLATDLAPRISPGWAVGWFFVPFAALWKPYQAMRQCWNSSTNPAGLLDGPAPSFMGWWWGLWVIESVVSNFSTRGWLKAETIETMRTLSWLDIATVPVSIISALLFIRLVRGIAAAQSLRSPPDRAGPQWGAAT